MGQGKMFGEPLRLAGQRFLKPGSSPAGQRPGRRAANNRLERIPMRTLPFLGALLGLGALGLHWHATTSEPARAPGPRQPFGLDKRVPWTTSNLKGFPEPPPPYRTE